MKKDTGKERYITRSLAAFEVNPVYTWEDLEKRGFDYAKDVGDPGEHPFTRGVRRAMYRESSWVINLYSGYGLPEDSSERFKRLLSFGVEGISMAVDLPTQIGIDSDHPLASGEVGRVGVAIDSLADMETLFREIDISKLAHVGMLGNSIGPFSLAVFLALAEKKGLTTNQWRINLQNDVLKEFATRGTQIFPIQPSVRVSTDVVKYCAQEGLSHFIAMNVCGAHMNPPGASWEMAFAMTDAITYIDDIIASGMGIDEFAHLLTSFLSIGSATIDLFEEVAKARAFRRIWAKLLKERYNAQSDTSLKVRQIAFIIAGATAQQPMNNVARIALGIQAAILSGVASIHSACWDEGLTIPSEDAVEVAIRTQQILRHETGSVTATADPLGGSYFLEDLTDRIEADVWEKMGVIENMGGAIAAIEKGFYQQKIAEGAYKIQQETWNGTRGVVGVNVYRHKDERIPLGKFKIDPTTEKKKIAGLKKLRRGRNNVKVKEALREVRTAAESGENLVPSTLAAVREYATIGEICDQLREVYGEYTEGAQYA